MKIEERWKQTPQLVIVHRLVESSKRQWLFPRCFCLFKPMIIFERFFFYFYSFFFPSFSVSRFDFMFRFYFPFFSRYPIFFLSLYFHSFFLYIPFISLWFHFLISAISSAKAPRVCVLLICRFWKTKGIFDDFLSA